MAAAPAWPPALWRPVIYAGSKHWAVVIPTTAQAEFIRQPAK